jgi:hypothetical protein
MNRKDFVRNALPGGATMTMFTGRALSNHSKHFVPSKTNAPFNRKFSPDFNIFNEGDGASLEEQIEWGYEQGFSAWESFWISVDLARCLTEREF